MKIVVRVKSKHGPGLKVGTLGRVTLLSSYHSVRRDSVRFILVMFRA